MFSSNSSGAMSAVNALLSDLNCWAESSPVIPALPSLCHLLSHFFSSLFVKISTEGSLSFNRSPHVLVQVHFFFPLLLLLGMKRCIITVNYLADGVWNTLRQLSVYYKQICYLEKSLCLGAEENLSIINMQRKQVTDKIMHWSNRMLLLEATMRSAAVLWWGNSPWHVEFLSWNWWSTFHVMESLYFRFCQLIKVKDEIINTPGRKKNWKTSLINVKSVRSLVKTFKSPNCCCSDIKAYVFIL